jgi:lipopolysaccharide transport system permease protein
MQTLPETIIEPGGRSAQYWRDLWRYRELFYLLAWRDLLVRYKQTVVGVAWSVFRPVLSMLVFVFIFGRVAKLPSGDVPYPILVFAALLPWQFFSSALTDGANSLLNNANLISKVYFPRMVVPASAVITTLADLMIATVLLGVLMLWHGYFPDARVLALPAMLALALATTLGTALWLSALTVKYRDLRIVIPFVAQFGFFLSPVGYSSSVIPEQWRAVYSLNPMVGVIDGFRWALLRDAPPMYLPSIGISIVVSLTLLITGIWYFRKTERAFADII